MKMAFLPLIAVLLCACLTSAQSGLTIGVPGYARGDVLFKDDFDNTDSLRRWTNYGDSRLVENVTSTANNNGTYGILNGRMYFDDPGAKPDNHMWTPAVFDGDFGISFDIEPRLPNEGGCILAYCALPMYPGGDLSGSGTGIMSDYYETVTCYHFSFAVSNTNGTLRNTSHLRKCGPGLWMCYQANVDPCAVHDSSYHVEIYKIGDHHFLYVDGNPIIHYVDNGTLGDSVYHKGYIGIRNWTGFQAYYDNFEVFRITQTTKIEMPGKDGLNPPVLNVFPNPFRAATRIAVSGHRIEGSDICIGIFNTNGAMLSRLSATSYQLSAGVPWNASSLPSGTYIIQADLKGKSYRKAVSLVK